MSSKITLPNGLSLPAVGFGTWQATDDVLEAALDAALETGYRHIDTAAVYENEHVIGKVLKKWFDAGKLKREDLFITTKLPLYHNRPEDVALSMEESLAKLQIPSVDLYLFHIPIGAIKKDGTFVPDPTTDIVATYKAMEKLVDAGKTKYLGVSNFNIEQTQRILNAARIKPVTNQIELHLELQQDELVDFLKKNNMFTTAYSSLGTPGSENTFGERKLAPPKLMENPVVVEIAKRVGKTPAQVLLRQILQRGIVVIPKSTNPQRIRQNFEIQDWSLTAEDMARLSKENKNNRILEFKNLFAGFGDHPEYPF